MNRPPARFKLSTAPEHPLLTVPRAVGKTNIGIYCNSCDEFISFAVEPPGVPAIEFTAEAPLLVRCPFCQAEEDRHVAEIVRFPLTEGKKRRLPRASRDER